MKLTLTLNVDPAFATAIEEIRSAALRDALPTTWKVVRVGVDIVAIVAPEVEVVRSGGHGHQE